MPILTYGAQSWALIKTQMESLRKTQRAMERSTMKIKLKYKIRSSVIREEIRIKDIGYTTKKLKCKYAGHVVRTEGDRWAKRMITWRPSDRKGPRGRPMCRWRDEI